MYKREIFFRTSVLITFMIISILIVFSFAMIKNHRLGVKNRMLSFGVLVAGEVERFIQWDDRLAADRTLARIIETNENYEYLFILHNEEAFADTFDGDIPADLLAHGTDYPEKAYYWEFKDNSGSLYCDFVIPLSLENVILRAGVKQSSIDKHLLPALVSIVTIGIIALIIGILLSFKIAVASTKEIVLLSDVIHRYNINNTPEKKEYNRTANSTGLIPELVDSFQKLAAERKFAEENLKQSLDEKEKLLCEIFHRTRNNMQVISALLYLQAEEYADDNVDRIVEETDNRIQAMSLVHQLLHETSNISSIDLCDLTISVSSFLFQKYQKISNRIFFNNKIGNISLSFDVAVPIGLILNELLTHSLLFGLKTGKQRTIEIGITRIEEDRLNFIYSDSSSEISESINLENNLTFFGLNLIYLIVRDQLRGTIKMTNGNSFYCSINFTDSGGTERI